MGKMKNSQKKSELKKSRVALSSECEKCMGCEKGKKYLENFNVKHEGKGVVCFKLS